MSGPVPLPVPDTIRPVPDTIRSIYLPKEPNNSKQIEKKVPKNRVITYTNKWIIESDDLMPEKQWEWVKRCHESSHDTSTNDIQNDPKWVLSLSLMRKKLTGYQAQDHKKDKYNAAEFVTMDKVIDLLFHCNNKCYYCKEPVMILYDHVREPKQWTLERIDNAVGHNSDNVEIACLQCNLKRRTMYHERFLFTKQLKIIRKP